MENTCVCKYCQADVHPPSLYLKAALKLACRDLAIATGSYNVDDSIIYYENDYISKALKEVGYGD